ncbi:MAG: transporter ATP-binding protein [Dehalococcoidia bacterium]|nr:transporter ATP-binding protein [Dehalococcoidia bacterium]
MATKLAVEVHALRKNYGSTQAVAGVDLHVAFGEVFALLGPNGAGKTTTVEILEGHRQRSEGEVRVLGHDPGKGERQFKERIGIVLQSTGIEPYLTVEETIDFFRSAYPHPRPLDEVLKATEMTDLRRARVRKLSGGQQRRLDVAVGLAGDPELLFLDEPTTGFDPSARRNAWQMIKNLKALGKTVFLTTHYMDEAQFLADRLAIMARGKIVAEGSPESVTGLGNMTTIRFRLPNHASLPLGLPPAVNTDGMWEIKSPSPVGVLAELTGWAAKQGLDLPELTVSRPSLEDTYLDLVGHAEEGEVKEPQKARSTEGRGR